MKIKNKEKKIDFISIKIDQYDNTVVIRILHKDSWNKENEIPIAFDKHGFKRFVKTVCTIYFSDFFDSIDRWTSETI